MASVYLVDDHALLRDALSELLAAHGHGVVGQSPEPLAAIAEIVGLRPEIVIVDLNLGPHSGFEVLAELQRRALPPKTIVTTMSRRPRDVADALRYGAEAYVLKGSNSGELLQAIDAVMAGSRHYAGEVSKLALQGLAARDDGSAVASLSVRERQVIMLVVNGHSSAEIAAQLHLSPKTIDSYRSRLMAKVGVRDVQGLVRFALRAGLIGAEDL